MEELNLNILRLPPRGRLRKILGIITFLIALTWINLKIWIFPPVRLFDIVYSIFFGLYGIVYFLDGSGISVASWFGQAFIKINNEKIIIKRRVLGKEWILLWEEVEEVEFRKICINFSLKDRSTREFNYDLLEWEHIQAIKESIKKIAAEKGIRTIAP